MDYIILDLEWNQPLSYNSSAYKSVGGKLLFVDGQEVIMLL